MLASHNLPQIRYITSGIGGHREDFDTLFTIIAKELGVQFVDSEVKRAVTDDARPVFYPMFDTQPKDTLRALLNAVIRQMRGYRTIGLFFRPGDCFRRRSFASFIRRHLFGFVAKLSNVRLLSLIPFELSPNHALVASHWIFDPQLWDLKYMRLPPSLESEELRTLTGSAVGKRMIVALGIQNRKKGFPGFTNLWISSKQVRDQFIFVVAGKVESECRRELDDFRKAGGVVIDRFIETSEMAFLYEKAEAIWTNYTNDYNQSSGIFGRAVQMGTPVVVRRGSYLERLGILIDHPHLAIDIDEPSVALTSLSQWRPTRPTSSAIDVRVSKMREHSLAVLRDVCSP